MTNEKQNNSNKILLVLLLLSVAFNIYQFSDKKTIVEEHSVQVDSLNTARIDVEKELNETYSELNQYKGINSKLDSLLQEANAKVDEQKAKIEALIKKEKNESVKNSKLQAEMEILKKLRDEYVDKVDALLVENEKLKKEKDALATTVATLTQNLENTVSTASVLKSEYFIINSFKKKGSGKYQPTALAKKTNKLESCFTILENTIAHAGERTVYLRVLEPGGKVLSNQAGGSGTFRKAGTEEDIQFTSSKLIEYKNDKISMCLAWEDLLTPLPAGAYMMEIYIDGVFSGASSLSLR